jgi:hypothetical protein
MVVACISLFVALGGVGYAAVSIDGKHIENRTIGSKKIKKNSLGGDVIKESKLGQVKRSGRADIADHAATADSATNSATATSAGTLGGLGPADFTQGGGHTVQVTESVQPNQVNDPILKIPGIGTIQASCDGAGVNLDLEFRNESGGSLMVMGQSVESPNTVSLSPNDPDAADGHTVEIQVRSGGVTTMSMWNTLSHKTATAVVSNVFCMVSAQATTNQ